MRVIICGSITAAAEMEHAARVLREAGYDVELPLGVTDATLRMRTNVRQEEKAEDKLEHDVIRRYHGEIADADAVLVVNPEKREVQGYIGGNTLIEMAFAHVLRKPLFVLYPLPNMPYTAEMLAMQPTILDGDIRAMFPGEARSVVY